MTRIKDSDRKYWAVPKTETGDPHSGGITRGQYFRIWTPLTKRAARMSGLLPNDRHSLSWRLKTTNSAGGLWTCKTDTRPWDAYWRGFGDRSVGDSIGWKIEVWRSMGDFMTSWMSLDCLPGKWWRSEKDKWWWWLDSTRIFSRHFNDLVTEYSFSSSHL